MKETSLNDLSKIKKDHTGEIENLKIEYETMKTNYENKIVQNVEQVTLSWTKLTSRIRIDV